MMKLRCKYTEYSDIIKKNLTKMTKISDRVRFVIENEKVTVNKFSQNLGYERSQTIHDILNSKSNPSYDFFYKFVKSEYSEFYNLHWLITGEGEMLKNQIVEDSGKKNIPLVTQSAVAGFGSMDFLIKEADVKAYYSIPKFNHCKVDFMIEISGSSMYPKYNSGDVVACTILHERSFIQWNKCHIIATREQGILCKRLRPSQTESCITAVSDNDNYPPFDIPVSDITGIALVVGVIRLE